MRIIVACLPLVVPWDFWNDVVDSVSSVVNDAADDVADWTNDAVETVEDAAGDAVEWSDEGCRFDSTRCSGVKYGALTTSI